MNFQKQRPTLSIYGIKDIKNSGYPAFVHDHNITFFDQGKIQWHVQLERLTRVKHDNSMEHQLNALLKSKKLLDKDFDLVFTDNVIGRAFISSSGAIRFEAPLVNDLMSGIEKGKCWWFGVERDAYILNHELSHIYSCMPFFGNFKENSLLVHFDGGASLSNFSVWTFKNQKLAKIESHWDLKYLSSFFNANALAFAIVGAREFDQHAVPGKLMGFASYGKYSEQLESWLSENQFFNDIWGKKSVFFEKAQKDLRIHLTSFDQKNSFIQNIAATFQYIFKRDFINKIIDIKNKTNTEYLYLTGGSALNILTNSEIIKRNIFKDVFIPPCTNDAGLSIGAGAFVEQIKHGNIQIHSPYLNNFNIEDYKVNYLKSDIEQVAKYLTEGKVVGVCNGYGESGPRALGNRSIFALANSKKLAKKVSEEHKKREWYRPVAPIMLEKNSKYFLGQDIVNHLSRYMLLDFSVLEERKSEIEGVVHVDGTSRIQTIFAREENPYIFDLLTELDENYGIKALINTSFNIKGEPIVHTIEDALKSARNMNLDGIVLNGKFQIIK